MVIPKSPTEFFLWRSTGSDIDSQKEFLEINKTIVVGIESSEYVFAKLFSVQLGKTLAVDAEKSCRSEMLLWGTDCVSSHIIRNDKYSTYVSFPSGQSCLKPRYHSVIFSSENWVWATRKSRSVCQIKEIIFVFTGIKKSIYQTFYGDGGWS